MNHCDIRDTSMPLPTQSLTQYHTPSLNLTLAHTIEHFLTQSHIRSHNRTLPHSIAHSLTQYHTPSHNRTLPNTISHSSRFYYVQHPRDPDRPVSGSRGTVT